jgi:hypothetical protein
MDVVLEGRKTILKKHMEFNLKKTPIWIKTQSILFLLFRFMEVRIIFPVLFLLPDIHALFPSEFKKTVK